MVEEALSTGNLTERLRAAELLTKLGATEKPQASGRILVNLGPETCPHCSKALRAEPAEIETETTLA